MESGTELVEEVINIPKLNMEIEMDTTIKTKESKEILEQIDFYISRGGEIEVVPSGVSGEHDNIGYHAKAKRHHAKKKALKELPKKTKRRPRKNSGKNGKLGKTLIALMDGTITSDELKAIHCMQDALTPVSKLKQMGFCIESKLLGLKGSGTGAKVCYTYRPTENNLTEEGEFLVYLINNGL